jgi:quercetin dioxygenase-like cupin family protein
MKKFNQFENLKLINMNNNKVFQLNTNIEYSSGSVVSKTIIKKASGTVTLFSFDKGQGLSPHVAPFDALVQVIDGECSFTVGTEKNSMKTGDCIILPAGEVHAVESVTAFKMLLTMIKSA